MVQKSQPTLRAWTPLPQKQGSEQQPSETQKVSSGTGYYTCQSHMREHLLGRSSHAGDPTSNLMVSMIQHVPGTI